MAVNSTQVRDAIKALLEEAGAENVYTEDPKLVNWDVTMEMLRQQNKQYIQCWVIRRVSSQPITSETHHGQVPVGCAVYWNHTFGVDLFFGYVENSSEDQMQTLIDQILTFMQTKRTLENTVFGVAAPLTLISIQEESVGGIGGYTCRFTIVGQQHEFNLVME